MCIRDRSSPPRNHALDSCAATPLIPYNDPAARHPTAAHRSPRNTRSSKTRRLVMRNAILALGLCIAVATSGGGTIRGKVLKADGTPISYTHLRAHETGRNLVC